ncbi:MAG: GNAT family N-acetyltransferase [Planctomycetes bacterium]|nr:GNAT family N-acetyltransferase [Planctomycetota bacterium]
MISYNQEADLSVSEFVDCLTRSTLAERRPVDDLETMEGMLRNADLIITARNSAGLLVGVSRAITDFHYCTYLSDLAVDQQFQGQKIGRELIRQTHLRAGLKTMLVLLSAPKAQTYYPHIGMQQHPSAWCISRQTSTKSQPDRTCDSCVDESEEKTS